MEKKFFGLSLFLKWRYEEIHNWKNWNENDSIPIKNCASLLLIEHKTIFWNTMIWHICICEAQIKVNGVQREGTEWKKKNTSGNSHCVQGHGKSYKPVLFLIFAEPVLLVTWELLA